MVATALAPDSQSDVSAPGHGLERLLRFGFIVLLVGAALSAHDTMRGPDGLPRRQSLEQDLARVHAENELLTHKINALHRDIVAQKDREIVQEALVRDVLGYVRPGEIILQPRP